MQRSHTTGRRVFSAHAEVVPTNVVGPAATSGILRARGGSSTLRVPTPYHSQYSPRTRR